MHSDSSSCALKLGTSKNCLLTSPELRGHVVDQLSECTTKFSLKVCTKRAMTSRGSLDIALSLVVSTFVNQSHMNSVRYAVCYSELTRSIIQGLRENRLQAAALRMEFHSTTEVEKM